MDRPKSTPAWSSHRPPPEGRLVVLIANQILLGDGRHARAEGLEAVDAIDVELGTLPVIPEERVCRPRLREEALDTIDLQAPDRLRRGAFEIGLSEAVFHRGLP
jgi:hypothetical protein